MRLPSTILLMLLLILALLTGCGDETTTPTLLPTASPVVSVWDQPAMPLPATSTLLPPLTATTLPPPNTLGLTAAPTIAPTATLDWEAVMYTPEPPTPLPTMTPASLTPLVATPSPVPAVVTATLLPADNAALNPLEQQMFEQLNAERSKRGLIPVAIDPRLQAIARSRSRDMVARNYFGHYPPEGGGFSYLTILKQQGIRHRYAGEIIYRDATSLDRNVSEAVEWWINDQIHADVILRPEHRLVGVGEAAEGSRHTYTVDYLTPVE